jgi:cell division septum initiation protein DivIVA
MTVDHQFNSLSDKLQLLLRQHHRLQKENEKLKEELHEAKDRELQCHQRLTELEQRVSILKAASGEMNEKDKREFEKKINQYIREVDKCISYLSQ